MTRREKIEELKLYRAYLLSLKNKNKEQANVKKLVINFK